MIDAESKQAADMLPGMVETLEHDMAEGMEVWRCACSAYVDYATSLAKVRTFQDLYDVQSKFVADTVDMFGRAAGALQRRGGINQPTLNEP
jgi:hypothetical protein